MRIIGIDASLTATGVAILDCNPDDQPAWHLHTIRSKGLRADTVSERHTRLHNIRLDITVAAIGLAGPQPDLVVIEAPAYSRNNAGTWDRAGLWWMLVDHFANDYRHGVPLAAAAPSARAKYATGKGNADKDTVLLAAARRYASAGICNNNEADAVVLAAMGARHLGHPVDGTIPAVSAASVDAVAWPDP